MASSNPYFSTQDIVNGTTLKTANEFILADKDNTERILFRLFQHVAEEVCLQLLTTIRALSRLNDEYIKLEDTNGEPYVLYAHNGNVFIPTCVNVNTIFVLSNYTNCYEDLPVIVQYLSHNVSAFLTTDLILRPTSRVINCDLITSRYFDFPNTGLLLRQIGNRSTFINRKDVLWQAIDSDNILLDNANSISHYHGVLDGLDVLSAKPEFTDFNEHGRTFVALDKEADPLSPQTWWQQNKWYFYGTAIVLTCLILGCSLCWVCTCANCCLFKMITSPCKSCIKAIKRYHATKKSKRTRDHPIIGLEPSAQALLLQSFPTAPTMSDQSRHESSKLTYTPTVFTSPIQFNADQTVTYRPTPSLNEIQVLTETPFRRQSIPRSSSERSHRKPRPLRVTRQRDVVS